MPDIRHPRSDTVHIRYTKWDGSLHWHFDADVVDRDDHGTWVVVPPGGIYRRGDEAPRVDEFGFVVLVPGAGWWTAYFNAVPRGTTGHLVYVDINTAAVWQDGTASMIDLDLDVTLASGEGARVIDVDEFDEHRALWSYPPDVVDRVRTTAARIATEIDLGREPFGTVGPGHVARTLGWAHGTVGPHPTEAGGFHTIHLPHRVVTDATSITGRVATGGVVHDATLIPDDAGALLLESTVPVANGDPISAWVDPAQASFDVA